MIKKGRNIMDQVSDGKIPLGLCKQAALKLESFIADVCEIKEDPDIDPLDKEDFEKMVEIAGVMEATIVNIVSKECGEEEFIDMDVPMDEMGTYPGDEVDVLDQSIE